MTLKEQARVYGTMMTAIARVYHDEERTLLDDKVVRWLENIDFTDLARVLRELGKEDT